MINKQNIHRKGDKDNRKSMDTIQKLEKQKQSHYETCNKNYGKKMCVFVTIEQNETSQQRRERVREAKKWDRKTKWCVHIPCLHQIQNLLFK